MTIELLKINKTRYEGFCTKCTMQILAGEPMYWNGLKGTEARNYHQGCQPKDAIIRDPKPMQELINEGIKIGIMSDDELDTTARQKADEIFDWAVGSVMRKLKITDINEVLKYDKIVAAQIQVQGGIYSTLKIHQNKMKERL